MERYGTATPLGKGASGEVVRVWDDDLRRYVARKLLRRGEPDAVERMFREARAQARLHHPNIAQVHDVGVVDERPAITMEWIDGPPLDVVARELGREERVRLIATVAEAIHSAHGHGLVHRDLKPSNILVSKSESGELRPVIVDFGIARDLEAPSLTMTGQMIGTPGYMAPEQARGDLGRLDRRADVYSLGVVLYELLTGRLPFEGANPLEVVTGVLRDEATPARRYDPSLPLDLETVVMTCLEKDPAARYDSARALAEDLRRWLRGDPVQVRPPGRRERWMRFVRRRPAHATAALATVLLLASFAGGAIWAGWRERRVAELNQVFAREAERLEHRMRLEWLLPEHETTDAQADVDRRIDRLRERVEELGQVARGPGLLAIGRTLLARGHVDAALDALEAAGEAGLRTDTLRASLGTALALRYRDEVRRSEAHRDAALRESQRDEARRRYGDRAARHLREVDRSGLAGHEALLLQGLLALVEGDHDAARAAGTRASEGTLWFHEGWLLAIEAGLAELRAMAIGDPAAAVPLLEALGPTAERLWAVAPSDPRSATARCDLAYEGFELARRTGGESLVHWGEGRRWCERALAVDPGWVPAHDRLAALAWRAARESGRRGEDPGEILEVAEIHARRIRELAPEDPRGPTLLGNLGLARGEWERDRGGDPLPAWEEASANLRGAVALAPGDPLVLLSLAHLLSRRATVVQGRGGDAEPMHLEAIELYRTGLERGGAHRAKSWNGICLLESEIGYGRLQKGRAVGPHFANAIAACREALAVDAGYLAARNNLGLALWSQGQVELFGGEDTPSLEEARTVFRQLLDENPGRGSTTVNLAALLVDLARAAERSGSDPEELLGAAEEAVAAIREVFPADAAFVASQVLELRATRVAPDADRDRLLRAGVAEARAAVESGSQLVVEIQLASVLARQAEAGIGSAESEARRILRSVEAREPGRPDAEAVRLRLDLVSAEDSTPEASAELDARLHRLERRRADLAGPLRERRDALRSAL